MFLFLLLLLLLLLLLSFSYFFILGTSNGVAGSLNKRVGGSCLGSEGHFPLKLAVHICADDNCPVCDSLECYTKGSVSFPSVYRCLLTWGTKIKLDVKSLKSMLDVALLRNDSKKSIGWNYKKWSFP